ncbi:MAG: methyltransferase domain-containing protein [Alphaproteobacteria bacterium]|nr:methyltransferase domain-containing protein [Alphaproteobacteria bacterium]
MSSSPTVFDRDLVRRRRDRRAAGFCAVDFLVREVADRLADRVADVARRFPVALDLGCHTGQIGAALQGRGGVETLVQCDLSPAMARAADQSGAAPLPTLSLAADEEALPFADNSFDLALSCLSLHWVNDLPGALVQVNRSLKPDGLFLGAMLGGATLAELRACLMEAEIEVSGGAGPRVSPFADLRDLGALMQRAGYALPVVDSEVITVTYENALALMAELRAMGEANAVVERARAPTARQVFLRAAELYQTRHAKPDGRIGADFEILYWHGWKPHQSQQQPLRPGAATTRLADFLDAEEISAGEKAGR